MKKTIILSGVAALTLALASCNLDTENPSSMEGEVIFSTPLLANKVVMGLHQSFGETNSYRGRFIPYFGINSDCEMFNNYGGVGAPATDKEASLACYSADVANSYMNTSNNAWAKLYEAIERANKGIADIDAYGDLSNKQIRHLKGELLTLRAMIYYDLVKAWGDVPARFDNVTSATLYLPRASRVDVLKRLIDDLKIAEDLVFTPGTDYAATTERVSTSFARGLRARVALLLAGKSMQVNGQNDYNIADPVKRDSLYRIALEECEYVIKNHPSQLKDLQFVDNFKKLCLEDTKAGKESIFEIPFSDGRGRVLYTWGGKHAKADQFTGLAKGGVNGPVPTLWFDYDPADKRRDITVLPYTWDDSGEKVTIGTAEVAKSWKTTSNLVAGGWSFGKLRFEWMTRRVVSTNDDGINWQVMRLADVYMMAAEAANELNDLTNAKKYIKPVMDRAYGETLAASKLAAANSKDSFFKLIVDERKFEFAGEALRKVDLMRWGILGEKMREAKQNLIDLSTRTGKYAAFPNKFYYNEGMDQDKDNVDSYYIYGMNAGETDDAGKDLKMGKSTYVFSVNCVGSDTPDKRKSDIDKIQKYLDNYFINDPDQKMFWPIWKVFIDSSNGQLINNYGY